ncbi:MAG: aminotransferase class V-fold PLP-dependent enzyme [Patescibacteria group bacterium]|jgi:cysteine desulfurase/selenocysteine lyase
MDDFRHLFPEFTLGTYLDYAATAPVFLSVLDAMREYEMGGRGNPRRGLHAYAARASDELERSRATVAGFVCADPSNLIFTKSATEGLNLAIESFTKDLGPGDEVVHTIYDHNSAYLPLKRAADARGFALVELGLHNFTTLQLSPRTKLVVLPHVSNVTGEVFPVAEIVKMAHAVGAKVIVDGAQAVAHMPVNVADLGADAYAFSAHKMYGPMGIGAVAFSKAGFDAATPFVVGGGMVEPGIAMFEAGTPNVTGAVGFAKACEELLKIGFSKIQEHECEIMARIVSTLSESEESASHSGEGRILRMAQDGSIFSFVVPGVHPHDVAQVLADHGVAIRAGHHCAPHISRTLDPAGVVRVSIGLPTTTEDIDQFFATLKYVESLR